MFAAALMVGVILLLLAREVWIAAFARPVITTDSRRLMMSLAEHWQPEGENGWDEVKAACVQYNQALEQIEKDADANPGRSEAIFATTDFNTVLVGNPMRPELNRARILIQSLDSEAIMRIGRATRFVGPLEPDPDERVKDSRAVISVLGMLRITSLSKLSLSRVAAMRLAAIDQDRVTYLRALRESFNLAVASSIPPTAISYAIAASLARRAYDEIAHEITCSELPAEWTREVLGLIDRAPAGLPVATALEGERIYELDGIQFTYAANGLAGGRLLRTEHVRVFNTDPWEPQDWDSLLNNTPQPSLGWMANLRSWWFPRRSETERTINHLFDALIVDATRPRDKRTFDVPTFDAGLPKRSPLQGELLGSVAGVMQRVLDSGDRLILARNAIRVLLALELHRAERGSYPDALDALSPQFLTELPTDPFAPDGRFRYKKLSASGPDADPHRRPYLLYSVGFDGIDSDGTPPSSGEMQEALIVEGRGSDYIINSERD